MGVRNKSSSETKNDIPLKQKPPSSILEFSDEKNVAPVKKKKLSKNLLLGLTYGLFSGLFFAACAASVKYLEELDPGQVACNQYIAIAVFALPMVVKKGGNLLGPKSSTKYWLLLCGFFDAITVYLSFISFRYLPLSDATVLTSSVPVFVTIAARIFLKEKCGTFQIIAIAISVVGVALVSKVPLLMANRTDVYTKESVIGLLASLGSILTESGVYVVLRKLHDVNVFIILFNFGIVATIINALLTLAFGEFTLAFCGVHQLLVIAVGVFSFLSQLALTLALELEEAGPVSVLMAAGDIILAFILDMTLFQDTPDTYTIAGTVLVVSSVMLVGIRKWLDSNLYKKSLKLKFMKILF
ncbi:solute carrier family 35 member G1-like [Parasteatoda tepidariorum]|uniref:solute carrier family 35 member G1-like n=1 Tax=Parasteatoda tepidariorum TaxID=114398 RepID=UPI00077FDCDD|nr:solute carrier family 35 member G1-like [Parasteatoda tepidariorum]